MSNIEWNLESAGRLIEDALQELKDTPEKTAIADLIRACEAIDRHYEKTCLEVDADYGEEPGFHYNNGGFNMEYYIESDWWHDISEALRAIKK